VSFGKIADAMPLPNLISVQKESFERFKTEGLAEAFEDASPIENNAGTMELIFGDHMFGDAPASIEECRAKDMSYQAAAVREVRFVNKETGEIKEQLVFMGDFPLMTDRGTFIINGTERVVVSQLVRSPGVYFSEEMDNGVLVHRAQFIPARGAWLEFEVDKRGHLVVSIDRKRHQSATVFLRALGIAESDDEIRALLGDSDIVRSHLERDVATTREDALIEIYRHQRPGEPPTWTRPAPCSTASTSTRSATTSPAWAATRSTRSSASTWTPRPSCSPPRTSSRRCATCSRCTPATPPSTPTTSTTSATAACARWASSCRTSSASA
jgi:DNA-directed RNA polymerase subunit beta